MSLASESKINRSNELSGEGKGQSDKNLILCAHYDSIAKSTIGWDWQTCPAPGANDNASGVAAMLEIARILESDI